MGAHGRPWESFPLGRCRVDRFGGVRPFGRKSLTREPGLAVLVGPRVTVRLPSAAWRVSPPREAALRLVLAWHADCPEGLWGRRAEGKTADSRRPWDPGGSHHLQVASLSQGHRPRPRVPAVPRGLKPSMCVQPDRPAPRAGSPVLRAQVPPEMESSVQTLPGPSLWPLGSESPSSGRGRSRRGPGAGVQAHVEAATAGWGRGALHGHLSLLYFPRDDFSGRKGADGQLRNSRVPSG